MSDEIGFARSASDIEAAAAEWFGRRQFWEWTEKDQAQLDAWLDENLAHRVAFWRLEGAWGRAARASAVKQPMRRETSPISSIWTRSRKLFAAAAVIAAITVIGTSLFLGPGSNSKTYETTIGERKTLALADGSRIELNTNTAVSISSDSRSVSLLRGEAFFNVKHNPDRQFVVKTGGYRVIDLGTQFLVRRDDQRVKVSLLQGKALLQSGDNHGRTALLVPGDIAVATKSRISVARFSNLYVERQQSWREGLLSFDNTTLGDAAKEFNRYNTTQLIIRDPSIAKMPVAGRFPINGVDRFADVVTHVFGLHVKTDQKSMTITQ